MNETNEAELKCPCCKELKIQYDELSSKWMIVHSCHSVFFKTYNEAIYAWNTRHQRSSEQAPNTITAWHEKSDYLNGLLDKSEAEIAELKEELITYQKDSPRTATEIHLSRKLEVAKEGLNNIASWSEGEEVNGTFDEPCSAYTARKALAKIGSCK